MYIHGKVKFLFLCILIYITIAIKLRKYFTEDIKSKKKKNIRSIKNLRERGMMFIKLKGRNKKQTNKQTI